MSPKRLGTILKTLRTERGWSQQQLAERVGVTDAYITQLERGTRKNPSLDVLKRLARSLGVPVTELLE